MRLPIPLPPYLALHQPACHAQQPPYLAPDLAPNQGRHLTLPLPQPRAHPQGQSRSPKAKPGVPSTRQPCLSCCKDAPWGARPRQRRASRVRANPSHGSGLAQPTNGARRPPQRHPQGSHCLVWHFPRSQPTKKQKTSPICTTCVRTNAMCLASTTTWTKPPRKASAFPNPCSQVLLAISFLCMA